MKSALYKLTPINRYWFNELFIELIFWKVKRHVKVKGDSFLTDSPQVVTLATEIFGDNLIQVEQTDEPAARTRQPAPTRRPRNQRRAIPPSLLA
jgi:hypothetical protein